MGSNEKGPAENNSFASRFGAIMAMTGMCVGMGSVWRFPYMVGQYGGGSFIVAFVVSMIVIVLPLAIVECGIGKGFGKGMIGVFTEALHSKIGGKILGSIFALGYYTMNFFYYVVMAVSVYFVYSSAISEWNVIPADQIYAHFFENKLELAIISVLLVMATIYVVMRGVEAGIEKMSKIIIPLMFVFFIIVAIFGIFCIDNIQLGYNWYLEPSLDVSTAAEGVAAEKLGADAVSTTLSGYTPYSRQLSGPDVELVKELVAQVSVPVFAEGRINTPEDIKTVMEAGAYAPIVGSAITRPQLITAKFAAALGTKKGK